MYSQDELFRDYLNQFFEKAKNSNRNYSLRAFAKKLKINPGVLSQLLKGKRKFTEKTIEKICDELFLSPSERANILDPSAENHQNAMILEQSMFETLSNWAHDAFLSLVQTKSFQHDIQWISKKLGITRSETRKIINNLLKVGLLNIVDEKYVTASPGTQVFVETNTTSALKKLQLDANTLSRIALENEPVDKRFHGTNTIAIDPKHMEEAKEYIREFRRRYCTGVNWNGNRARVYQLNVSFYPIDQENT